MNDIKLGEWIEETVTVKATVPEVDEKGNVNFVEKEIKGREKVMYVDPPKRMVICARGKHNFVPKDPSRGMFACVKCDYRYKTYPVSHEFYRDEMGGHLKNKHTFELV